MRPTTELALAGLCVALLALAGCRQEEVSAPAPVESGVVAANRAYLENFGEPPQGKAGEAFARVGYLPLLESPQQVRAFPLFLFSEKDQLQQILNRLVSGELPLPESFGLYNPFPADLQLTATSPENPALTLSLLSEVSWSDTDKAAAGRTLAESVFQFPRVEKVVVMLNGQPLAQMPADGYRHEPGALAAVRPPQLILMAGMWKRGSDRPDELLAEFDRPVKINNFKLYAKSGEVVEGEYFTSVFQMAVVVLPKDPTLYQESTVLRAEWDVVDGLGRSNSGSTTLPLLRYEH
ncbi:MAG: GerMN domain-containing protein [Desulfuromonadales bacterium]